MPQIKYFSENKKMSDNNSMKRLIVIMLLLAAVAGARPWVLLFGTGDCDECAALKKYWVKTYTKPTDPVLVFVNVDKKANYRFLNKIEDEIGIMAKGSTFPVVMVGRKMVNGIAEFKTLEPKLDELLAENVQHSLLEGVAQVAAESGNGSLVLYDYQKPKKGDGKDETAPQAVRQPKLLFFMLTGCKKCSRQSKEFELLREAMPSLEIAEYNVATVEGMAMMARVRRHFGLPGDEAKNLAPMVVWAEGFVTGRLAKADELQTALTAPLTGEEFWLEALTEDELQAERSRMKAFLDTMTIGSVVLGGLLDGINPCAFATSVFLISYLLYLKKRRREILIVGGCFCIGVFLTYFMYGLALSYVLEKIQAWRWVKIVIYGGFATCGFVLCIMHLRDAFRYRKTGKASDMDMGLSKETHRGIHDKIKKFTTVHAWLLGPAAVVLGAIVSSMELACTGQILLPVLTVLMKDGVTARALWLLLLYNVLFIMPLAVITILAAYGVGAKALGDWAKKHVFATKVLMAVLFEILGVVMLLMMSA